MELAWDRMDKRTKIAATLLNNCFHEECQHANAFNWRDSQPYQQERALEKADYLLRAIEVTQ